MEFVDAALSCRFLSSRIKIGVVIKILPSLLNNSVIKKHSNWIYQYKRWPEPFDKLASLAAAQWKKPKLSNITAMTMVAIMVMDAPPILLMISIISTSRYNPSY